MTVKAVIEPKAVEAVKKAEDTAAALEKGREPKEPPVKKEVVSDGQPTLNDLVKANQKLTNIMREKGMINMKKGRR